MSDALPLPPRPNLEQYKKLAKGFSARLHVLRPGRNPRLGRTLGLVSIGIFGVASYSVAQRTNELGIRTALGASRWSVIRESLRDTMQVFAAGLAAGIIAAIAAVRLTASFISELLFGLTGSHGNSRRVIHIGEAVVGHECGATLSA